MMKVTATVTTGILKDDLMGILISSRPLLAVEGKVIARPSNAWLYNRPLLDTRGKKR